MRRMDWAVTARTTVPHVREVDADRELATWAAGRRQRRAWTSAPPSWRSGSWPWPRWPRSASSPPAPATGSARTCSARTGCAGCPARSGRTHLLGLLRALLAAPARGADGGDRAGADAGRRRSTALHRAAPPARAGRGRLRLPRRPADDPAGTAWERPLRRLAARHQVLAVEVIDPRELELPDVGLLTLVDPETGRRREVRPATARLRERYAEAAARTSASRSGRRCAGPAPPTWCCAPTATGSPTSSGTCTPSAGWPARAGPAARGGAA